MGNCLYRYSKYKVENVLDNTGNTSPDVSINIHQLMPECVEDIRIVYNENKTKKIIEKHRKTTNEMKKKYNYNAG